MRLYFQFFLGVLLVATLFSCHNKKSDDETGLSAEDSALVIISNRQLKRCRWSSALCVKRSSARV